MTAMAIASTKDMSREEWLQLRKKGLGGSDVAAVAGISKYKSRFGLFLEKTEQIQPEEISSEAAYWGTTLEDVVAKEFALRTGMKVRKKNQMLRHKEHYFMMANLDRVIVGKNEILECKTASEYLKGEWDGDEVPADYLLQIMHYMAVTGADACWIAVLVGGNKFIYKRIERDEELIAYIIDMERDFWENHVMKGNAPAIDGTDASTNFLKTLYPESIPDSQILLPDEVDDIIAEYDKAKEEKKAVEEKLKEAENKIKMMLGENESGKAHRHIVDWKSVTSNRVDSKALKSEYPDVYEKVCKPSISRRFNIKAIKEAN